MHIRDASLYITPASSQPFACAACRVTEAMQRRVLRLEGFVVALGVLVALLCLSSAVPGFFRYLGTAAAVALGGLALQGMLSKGPRSGFPRNEAVVA